VTSVGEKEEKANTIQPPLSCVFLTFKPVYAKLNRHPAKHVESHEL